MTPTETAAILRQFNEWRRDFDDKVEQPDSYEIGEALDAACEMIERMDKLAVALRQHHNNKMGEGFDLSHPLTALMVSGYQASSLYAKTVAALGESK